MHMAMGLGAHGSGGDSNSAGGAPARPSASWAPPASTAATDHHHDASNTEPAVTRHSVLHEVLDMYDCGDEQIVQSSALILVEWGSQLVGRDSHLAVLADAARHYLQGFGIGTRRAALPVSKLAMSNTTSTGDQLRGLPGVEEEAEAVDIGAGSCAGLSRLVLGEALFFAPSSFLARGLFFRPAGPGFCTKETTIELRAGTAAKLERAKSQ